MKIRRHRHFEAEVTTSSLNDIMFFLLLFFLIVATFANPNVIKLMLPKAQSTQTMSKKQITLSVTADKRYYIDKTEVGFENLKNLLQQKQQEIPDLTVVLRTDASLTVQDLVDVLQIGNQLKIKMILATDK
ncbi:MAG: biopolymer transporter ExbD [Chitinophagales bacterium]|jgi:biopolymer transport protein ExbD|nr:biopolymer transporter ExbD [Chitinophagales bacterium]HNI43936.1 biopolymer transporter ExbD [Chitinophagales bacterium]HNL08263.1 biopolymer transporter ExbD [Chitinophagales bacterium]